MKHTNKLFAWLLTALLAGLLLTCCTSAAFAAGEDAAAPQPAADASETADTDGTAADTDTRVTNLLFGAMAAQLLFDVALVILLKRNHSLPSLRRKKAPMYAHAQRPVAQTVRLKQPHTQPSYGWPGQTVRTQGPQTAAVPWQNRQPTVAASWPAYHSAEPQQGPAMPQNAQAAGLTQPATHESAGMPPYGSSAFYDRT